MNSRLFDELRILGPRVLVRPLMDLDLTESGLVMPDSARKPQNRAVVEKVGQPEVLENGTTIPMPVHVGDIVTYQKFAGVYTLVGGQERLTLMREEITGYWPAGSVQLVSHGDADSEHLEGEPCSVCQQAAEQADKSRFLAMRDEFRKGPSVSQDDSGEAPPKVVTKALTQAFEDRGRLLGLAQQGGDV